MKFHGRMRNEVPGDCRGPSTVLDDSLRESSGFAQDDTLTRVFSEAGAVLRICRTLS
jgi:hypothetical protein